MKILIATGIYPPDIGGPAQYAKNLKEEFLRLRNSVVVLTYTVEKKLPTGIRHLVYFFKVLFNIGGADFILILDTFSVGLPAILASRFFRKKIIIRTGGDFLWESYVERTGDMIPLSQFYKRKPTLSLKERIIYILTKYILNHVDALVFSTAWQKELFIREYGISSKKTHIIENYYGNKMLSVEPAVKNFVWAVRPLKLKNGDLLKKAFEEARKENLDIVLDVGTLSYDKLLDKIRTCYAVILPSISEISPNFILDAIRLNKPFIMTKETGFYEKLKEIGIFIDPLDEDDIKNKILYIANIDYYREYKQRIAHFSFTHPWQEIANEFLVVYKTL